MVVVVLLSILWVFGAAMLYVAPVRNYTVTCDRTTDLRCVLERTEASGPRRTVVPLAEGATAAVRILPRRRGPSRVTLELHTPQEAFFAAEFEGANADSDADAAAAELNAVLRGRTAPAHARVVITPPPMYRIASWFGLAVMGLLILAIANGARGRAAGVSPEPDGAAPRPPLASTPSTP